MRVIMLLVAVALFAAGCSDDKPAPAVATEISVEKLKQDCADPKWREQNLGLWYSVCRQPVHW